MVRLEILDNTLNNEGLPDWLIVNEISSSTLALDACPCFLCPIEDQCLALKHHNGCSYIEQWALLGISNAKAGLVEKIKESDSNEKGKAKTKSKGTDF